jgi:hypothetical protein
MTALSDRESLAVLAESIHYAEHEKAVQIRRDIVRRVTSRVGYGAMVVTALLPGSLPKTLREDCAATLPRLLQPRLKRLEEKRAARYPAMDGF